MNTVYLNIEHFQFNNTTFQCLFHLLPNLKIIEPVNMLHGVYTLTELF